MKCFLIGILFVCSNYNVDVRCVKKSVEEWERDLLLYPDVLESVMESCSIENLGCCLDEGVDTCD